MACGFAIMVVPSPSEGEPNEARTNASSFGSQATKQQPQPNAASWAGEHTLKRRADGHFYASASIDGASVEMMVDTGATVIALTADDATAAGLYWDDSDVRHIGSGASGAVYGVPTRLREVEIGGMVRRNVSAVIIPEGLGISLLGQSYLSQIGALEIADDQMVMSAD